mgnify:CR=1 FL=1
MWSSGDAEGIQLDKKNGKPKCKGIRTVSTLCSVGKMAHKRKSSRTKQIREKNYVERFYVKIVDVKNLLRKFFLRNFF